ncbi:hypothetical protein D3C80_2057990 [compost metagenome]
MGDDPSPRQLGVAQCAGRNIEFIAEQFNFAHFPAHRVELWVVIEICLAAKAAPDQITQEEQRPGTVVDEPEQPYEQ